MSFLIPNENVLVAFTASPVGLMSAPAGVTAAASGSGALPAGPYAYKVTGVNDTGETTGSTEATVTTTSTGGVTVSWTALAGATAYRIYGRTAGSEKLITQVGQVTSWLDSGAIAVGTKTPPAQGNASNLFAPHIADVQEAVDLTRFITACNFSATGQTVETATLKSLFVPNIEGTSNGQASIDGYRDDEIDLLWETLPRRTRGFFFISRLKPDPVIGDPIEVWPVRVSTRAAGPMTSNQSQTCSITCAVPAEPAETAVIAA
jgi:hypothetical protein